MGTAAYSQSRRRGTAPRATPRVPTQSRAPAQTRVVDHTGSVRRNLLGTLLIANEDGSPLSGALRLAEALARRDGVNAHVFSVARPLSSSLSHLVSLVADLERHELEACRLQIGHARVRRQVHETVGLSTLFSTGVERGEPVSATAATARVRTAEFILVGLPKLGSRGRAGIEDAAFRVAKAAGVPVLAVPAHVDRLPRTALVHMDLGEASVRAARAALPLLADGGSLTLVHVVPNAEFAPPDAGGRVEVEARRVAKVLRQLGDELRLAGNLEVRSVVLQGDPARLLSDLAQDYDLTAVGAPKRGASGRFLMGSVSADVLRAAGGTVLIAPNRDG